MPNSETDRPSWMDDAADANFKAFRDGDAASPSCAPLPSAAAAAPPPLRAKRKAAEWFGDITKAVTYFVGRGRGMDEEALILLAYDKEVERGPDFTRYHGGSEFRDAPKITLDRNELARNRVKLVTIFNGGWATKEKGKHAGLVKRTTINVYDALCGLAKKHERVFPSLEGLAYLAKCCKNTVLAALEVLKILGFVTTFRRIKRIKTALGFRTVQATNAYQLNEPNTWGELALSIFTRTSESNKCEARRSKFHSNRPEAANSTPSGSSRGAWAGLLGKWAPS